MKITHTLIQKFLDDQCSTAEAAVVARHLKKYPELTAIYLRSSWEAAGKETAMPAGYTEEMRQAIEAHMAKHTRTIRFRWLAVAASLLIVATAGWLLTPQAKAPVQTLAKAATQDAATATWNTRSNTSAKLLSIKLDDGSVVKLAPKASIKYQQPFGQQGQRDIYMEGEADFEVAPDKARPFTVHNRLFATRALGTAFRVSETAKGCTIKLFHGKVLIKPETATLKGWKQDIILLPGHEMTYNGEQGAVALKQFNAAPTTQTRTANNTYSKGESSLVFDNTPLPDVMRTLMTAYHTPIFYNEEQLKEKYFSGQVLKGDSLSVILNVIASMNGLQVTQKEQAYTITQSK